MNVNYKMINYLVLFAMLVLFIRPVILNFTENQTQSKTQYSTANSCPGRTVLVSSCQMNSYYTVANEYFAVGAYLFLLACLLYFLVSQSDYKSPILNIFRPPILG